MKRDIGELTLGYETHGERGDSVLLITGLGWGRWAWSWQVDALARDFRVIALDIRGVGESDAPPGPYTAEQMAGDAAGLLDALGIERAHVVGASLGGCIAQELALHHPDKVDRLVLCCTTFGGPNSLPMPEAGLRLIAEAPSLPEDVRLRRFVENALTDAFVKEHPEVVERILEYRRETAQPLEAWQAQAAAGASFDAADRVAEILAETLVVTGTDDRVVDPVNARLLSQAIPGATLAELPGGHVFFIEQAERFNALVRDFLLSSKDLSAPRLRRAASPGGLQQA